LGNNDAKFYGTETSGKTAASVRIRRIANIQGWLSTKRAALVGWLAPVILNLEALPFVFVRRPHFDPSGLEVADPFRRFPKLRKEFAGSIIMLPHHFPP